MSNLYPWVQLAYNVSVSLSLYCLVIFYTATHKDLALSSPTSPRSFLFASKAIVFFSYWQGFGISILVGLGIIHDLDSVTAENIASYIQAWLICIEMVVATWGHWYSFSYKDYIPAYNHAARMRLPYAIRDALGLSDVFQDVREAYSGKQYTYHFFEPVVAVTDLDTPMPVAAPSKLSRKDKLKSNTTPSSSSSISSTPNDTPSVSDDGQSRPSSPPTANASRAISTSKKIDENRLRAGMRYTKGGSQTYWLPVDGGKGRLVASRGQLGHHSPFKTLKTIGHHRSRREREAQVQYIRDHLTQGHRGQQNEYTYQYQFSSLYPVPPKLVKVRESADGTTNYSPVSDDEDPDEELYKLDFEHDALGNSSDEKLFADARKVEADYPLSGN